MPSILKTQFLPGSEKERKREKRKERKMDWMEGRKEGRKEISKVKSIGTGSMLVVLVVSSKRILDNYNFLLPLPPTNLSLLGCQSQKSRLGEF